MNGLCLPTLPLKKGKQHLFFPQRHLTSQIYFDYGKNNYLFFVVLLRNNQFGYVQFPVARNSLIPTSSHESHVFGCCGFTTDTTIHLLL